MNFRYISKASSAFHSKPIYYVVSSLRELHLSLDAMGDQAAKSLELNSRPTTMPVVAQDFIDDLRARV